ncbi:hypothetical protein MCOR25_008218 [Pyricularia grisea]|nr:hypothetical protein MCOR25_008218 [Pyricularia grisea]
MGGGNNPPGFPHSNPTLSYWQDPPHKIANHRTTETIPDQTWDYVIVGSGVSGAATAFKLLSRDPSLKVIMLEARTAASGASGRNGGHCRPGWWLHFRLYATTFGVDEALKFEALEEGTVQDIADFVREHKVDNDFQDVETADIFVTAAGWEDALAQLEFREEVRRQTEGDRGSQVKKKVLHGDEARRHVGMPDVQGAIVYRAHAQNPYLLVCRMLELAMDKGLNLQTNTPALAVKQEDGGLWTVDTDRGKVRARNVVLATNAYSNSLHAGLAGTKFLVPARSQVAALRPGKSMDSNFLFGRSGGPCDVPTGDYFMTAPRGSRGEGDVLWGGGRSVSETSEVGITDDSSVNEHVASYLHRAPAIFYGAENWGRDKDGERGDSVVRDWTGITCYTPDTLPLVGAAPGEPGLWMTIGMNGHGMAMAFRCAEALVQTMLGDEGGEMPDWFPKCMRLERAWEKPKINVNTAWFADFS